MRIKLIRLEGLTRLVALKNYQPNTGCRGEKLPIHFVSETSKNAHKLIDILSMYYYPYALHLENNVFCIICFPCNEQ